MRRDLAAGRLFTVGAARPAGTSRENVAVAVSATSTPDRSASRPLNLILVRGGASAIASLLLGVVCLWGTSSGRNPAMMR